MTETERLEKLEKTVEKIGDHLKRAPIPYVDGLVAKVRALEERVEAIEKKK